MRTIRAISPSIPATLGTLAVVLVIVAGCMGSAGSAPTAAPAMERGAPVPAIGQPGADAATTLPAGGPGTASDGSAPLYDVARPDLLIIKTGTMSLQVDDVVAAVDAANAKVVALGGYASGSSQGGDGESLTASVTYRIPVAQWDAAVAALRAIATKVVDAQTQTQDVTGQVVDLGARLTNLQATERALQEIMTRATKISDVLDVQAQLTTVRGEIEQATAEKQHLQEQAAFSTLTVAFGLKPVAAVVQSQQSFDPGGEIDRASAALVTILQGLATAGIWFAIVWLPVVLVVGAVALVVLWALRRRRSTRADGTDAPPSGPPAPPADLAAPPVAG
jgi:hypothetical protein